MASQTLGSIGSGLVQRQAIIWINAESSWLKCRLKNCGHFIQASIGWSVEVSVIRKLQYRKFISNKAYLIVTRLQKFHEI